MTIVYNGLEFKVSEQVKIDAVMALLLGGKKFTAPTTEVMVKRPYTKKSKQYARWTALDDQYLIAHANEYKYKRMARDLNRTVAGIGMRIAKLRAKGAIAQVVKTGGSSEVSGSVFEGLAGFQGFNNQ